MGSLKMNTALEYSTRVVQEGDRRCKKSTLNDLAYLTPLRIPLMNPGNNIMCLGPHGNVVFAHSASPLSYYFLFSAKGCYFVTVSNGLSRIVASYLGIKCTKPSRYS